MRVDFYQLSRDPAELVVPLIARNTLGAGERLLVVSEDEAQLARIGEALWTRLPIRSWPMAAPVARMMRASRSCRHHGGGSRPTARSSSRWPMAAGAKAGGAGVPAVPARPHRRSPRHLAPARHARGVERKYWRQDGGKWREGP
jgi:DNA polymerase-3 subunit chi